jgi:hypothetical protein
MDVSSVRVVVRSPWNTELRAAHCGLYSLITGLILFNFLLLVSIIPYIDALLLTRLLSMIVHKPPKLLAAENRVHNESDLST